MSAPDMLLVAIALFPAIVAILLRGKYFKLVLLLTLVNLAIAWVEYVHTIVPSNRCNANHLGNCDKGVTFYTIVFTFNIVIVVVAWYLAFKKKEELAPAPYDMSDGPLVGSQLAQKSGGKVGLRKILTASSWLIAFGIIAFVAGIILILTVIGFG